MATTTDRTETAILSRALDPQVGALSAELAEHVLTVGLTDDDKRAAEKLAALSARGELSDEQAAELDNYRRAGRLFELLKSKARLVLKNR